MSEPQFPVDLVSPDGRPAQAGTQTELVQLVYGEGYRLRRAGPGLEGIAVAPRSVHDGPPREVTAWRGMAAADPSFSPERSKPAPDTARRSSRSTPRKGHA